MSKLWGFIDIRGDTLKDHMLNEHNYFSEMENKIELLIHLRV